MLKVQQSLVKIIRSTGQALDAVGSKFECHPHIDKLQPSLRAVKLGKNIPEFKNVAFVAPSATVVGKVSISDNSSVWYGATIRGDVNYIKIGQDVTVGDRCMIHCSGNDSNHPTTIGNNVVIGSGSILHGCTIENDSLIGEGAQVMDGAKVSSNSILLGGGLLTSGKVIPSRQVWGGAPAKYVRDVTDADTASLKQLSVANTALATEHRLENAKTWQTIEVEEFDHEQIRDRDPSYYRRLTPEEMSAREGEIENHMIPGRILDSPVSARNQEDRGH